MFELPRNSNAAVSLPVYGSFRLIGPCSIKLGSKLWAERWEEVAVCLGPLPGKEVSHAPQCHLVAVPDINLSPDLLGPVTQQMRWAGC